MMKLLLALAFLAVVVHAEDWAQFRGSNGSGVSSSTGLPVEFAADKQVAWKAKVGDGVGSAIVKSGRVFVTAMVAEQKLGVLAFDAQGDGVGLRLGLRFDEAVKRAVLWVGDLGWLFSNRSSVRRNWWSFNYYGSKSLAKRRW